MRQSQILLPTMKETPADAQVVSHRLMMRSGMIRKLAAGIYTYMPLGLRVIRKIETIIREELNRAGAEELLLPAIQPGELWAESGRWSKYGPELLRVQDRKGTDYCVGPTHEEVITAVVRDELRSYKQLPKILFQIQTKFRDEIRPRFGLMRGREFIMKDAYSFDVDDAAAGLSYQNMYDTYRRIFDRIGLDYRPVEADTGAIGGNRSHEFQVLAQSGEDDIVACDSCDYAANIEKAEIGADPNPESQPTAPLADVDTPGKKTIEEVAKFLHVPATQLIKTLIFVADGQPIAALCQGDHEVNEIKLRNQLGAEELQLADDATVQKVSKAPVGFAGPVGLSIPVYADQALQGRSDMVCGANSNDQHKTGVSIIRDVKVERFLDLRSARAGDLCGRCGGHFLQHRGIEVGQVFFLGRKYSKAMNCTFLDEGGSQQPAVMGCYGIGVGRTAAAAIEQNHDDNGPIWPMAIAPYQVHLLRLGPQPEIAEAADAIYQSLLDAGIEVLYDDRNERPGAKFKDADLIGVPLRIALGGKGLSGGYVEWKPRHASDVEQVPFGDVVTRCQQTIKAALTV